MKQIVITFELKMSVLKVFIPLAIVVLFCSCSNEKFYTGTQNVLTFSQDTLTFDTVFTSRGSVTRFFTVHNPLNQAIEIDQIKLEGLHNDQFRINVDGISGTEFEKVTIPANDYLYVFSEATIDPNNDNNPFVLVEEINYFYNGVQQKSYLQAWGQNAYFHFGEILENQMETWQCDKPHVIVRNDSFPGLGIDSSSTLNIPAGCKLYFSFGAGIFVDGKLNVGTQGSMDSVTLRSDRVEENSQTQDYSNTPGLWFGLGLFSGSESNFHNVRINESTYGIMGRFIFSSDFQSFTDDSRPKITLDRVMVSNSQRNGLIALNCDIEADNCVFNNAGSNLVALALGGKYTFNYCTINNASAHQDESLFISDIASNGTGGGAQNNGVEQAFFTNCIINGSLSNEFGTSISFGDSNYLFTNCLIKTERDTSNGKYINCLYNENPDFVDAQEMNFSLDTLSPCIDRGMSITGINQDFYFKNRDASPDIGAFEF